MNSNIDLGIKARENTFWMEKLSYLEPIFLWFMIRYRVDWPIFYGWSIVLFVTLAIVRFLPPVRWFVYPVAWGILVSLFTSNALLPEWLDVLAIMTVVGARVWLFVYEE